MVSKVAEAANPTTPAPLSAGASQAFSSVLSRILRKDHGTDSHILSKSSSVRRAADEARQARATRRKRKSLDGRGRIGRDVTRNRERERKLRMTATRGAVAMFEAMAKAKRGTGEKKDGKDKGGVVSREGFMSMIREGVRKSGQDLKKRKSVVGEREVPMVLSDSENDDEADGASGPGWAALKDNYVSLKNRKKTEEYNDSESSEQNDPIPAVSSDDSDDSGADEQGSE